MKEGPAVTEPPELTVIVVSYECREMTLACLASLKAQTTRTRYELIVVDNASTDGTVSALNDAHPDLTVAALRRNVGFAQANNAAARAARGELILLLNPDTVILNGAVDRLVAFARARPQARIWGGRTIFADGALNPTSCWRAQDLWSVFCRMTGLASMFSRSPLFNREGYGGWARDDERAVDIVTGCFLLIERRLWEDLGGFDPAFVMYGEEADLCLRARRLGARPRVTPTAEIVHHGGGSQKVRSDKIIRLLRAKLTLIQRHWRWPARPLGQALLVLWPGVRVLASRVTGATGAGGYETTHAAWADVWRRRREWRNGYGR